MLLAVDIGNSTVSMGVIKNGGIIAVFKFPVDKASRLTSCKESVLQALDKKKIKKSEIDDVIVSSVVPKVDAIFNKFASKAFKNSPFFVSSDTNLGIDIRLKNPSHIGTDRLVNACAAHFLIKGCVIVVDFGTAITFDYVTKKGEFMGGVIAPGVDISIEALHKKTSKLPVVKPVKVKKVIGKDTTSAIQSGIYNGYIGLIENIVSKMKSEIKDDAKVLATGGAFTIFKQSLDIIDIYDAKLTLKGLNRIFNLNRAVIL
jgi:type III pantothenate kinase